MTSRAAICAVIFMVLRLIGLAFSVALSVCFIPAPDSKQKVVKTFGANVLQVCQF